MTSDAPAEDRVTESALHDFAVREFNVQRWFKPSHAARQPEVMEW